MSSPDPISISSPSEQAPAESSPQPQINQADELVNRVASALSIQPDQGMASQLHDIAERLSGLITQMNVRKTTQDGMETSISGLTTTVVDLHQSVAALEERVKAAETAQAAMPGMVSDSINTSLFGTQRALEVTLGHVNANINQLTTRVNMLEAVATSPAINSSFSSLAAAHQNAGSVQAPAPQPNFRQDIPVYHAAAGLGSRP